MNRFLIAMMALVVSGSGAVYASSPSNLDTLNGRVGTLEAQMGSHGGADPSNADCSERAAHAGCAICCQSCGES